MSRYDFALAQARVNRVGDWLLCVPTADIYVTVFNDRDLASPGFPGNELGHRLVGLGWMPDRRAMYGPLSMSRVEELALLELAGWVPSTTQERVWSIPVYREA